MSSPVSPLSRERLHMREVRIEGFQRSDGLWDIEGRLSDVKDHDFEHVAGIRPAGRPIHDMWLRIAVDEHLKIHEAEARMNGVPFPGTCDAIAPDYARLVGLTIGPGFRKQVSDLLGGTRGCSHVTELLWSLATAAYQTLAQHLYTHQDPARKPFHIEGCHAWDSEGPMVLQFFPRWYKPRSDAA
jgi:hypothetical protein